MGSNYKRNNAGCIMVLSMVILSAHTALVRSSHKSISVNPSESNKDNDSREIIGIWPVTKLISLLGPTVSIYIYHELYGFFEKNGPMLSAKFQTVIKKLNPDNVSVSDNGRLRSFPDSVSNEDNPYVQKVANEVIRITNMRLREKALVSRIQMDDDQYELSRRHTALDVARMATNVLEHVLSNGSGASLDSKEKIAVRTKIKESIAQYAVA